MKIYICKDLDCAYYYDGEELCYAPFYTNDLVFDTEEFSTVDADIVGEELVIIDGKEITFNELYERIIKELQEE